MASPLINRPFGDVAEFYVMGLRLADLSQRNPKIFFKLHYRVSIFKHASIAYIIERVKQAFGNVENWKMQTAFWIKSFLTNDIFWNENVP